MDKIRAMAMAAELSDRSVGGWTVEGYLGNGCSAVVLSARRKGLGAALKVIDPEMVERHGRSRQLARIMREQSLKGKSHQNLVHILDGGQCEDTGHLYVVMELLTPRTLGDVRETLPTSRIGPLIGQLAAAARFLEELDIVHRDIKPDNTHVSSDCTDLKLLDLGVIRPSGDRDAADAGTGSHFIGTARYSPPEFVYREEEDSPEGWRAITFYQLGATLFDLLTRTPIFDEFREPPAKLYEAIRDHVPLLDPSETVDPWLVQLARNCLTKDWRIRSQLVSWEDFEGPREPSDSASEVRDRIRARGEIEMSEADRRQSEPSRSTRQELIEICRTMSAMMREVCIQGGVFPPVEIQPAFGENQCSTLVRTGPSTQIQLSGVLEVEITFRPLVEVGDGVRVSARCWLGAGGDLDEPFSEDGSKELYLGAVNCMEFRELVDKFLHASLESALGAGKPTTERLALNPEWR